MSTQWIESVCTGAQARRLAAALVARGVAFTYTPPYAVDGADGRHLFAVEHRLGGVLAHEKGKVAA